MKTPFPYFGGKASVADDVWGALGQPKHYIEPFFGSGAVLLNRPEWTSIMVETVNDADGFVANVWRAIRFDPDEVSRWCDWPVNHADLIARKARLIREENYLLENLCKDDKWFDAELAGYWVWAASCWIGSGLTRPGQIPHLTTAGMGVHGAHRQHIYDWMRELSARLRNVRVVCGDWARVCGGNWQNKIGVCGIFFDPPYGVDDRDAAIYQHESLTVARDVAEWSVPRGADPTYRIVIAGYIEEHEWLVEHGWTVKTWNTSGGYANTAMNNGETQGKKNRFREALFFSPHCKKQEQRGFFKL